MVEPEAEPSCREERRAALCSEPDEESNPCPSGSKLKHRIRNTVARIADPECPRTDIDHLVLLLELLPVNLLITPPHTLAVSLLELEAAIISREPDPFVGVAEQNDRINRLASECVVTIREGLYRD